MFLDKQKEKTECSTIVYYLASKIQKNSNNCDSTSTIINYDNGLRVYLGVILKWL